MLAILFSFQECELYKQYTPSNGSADQCMRKILQYEVKRKEFNALFPTMESVSQAMETFRNSSALKGRVMQILAEYNSAQKGQER